MKIPLREYWTLLSTHIRVQKLRFMLLTGLVLVSIGLQIINPQVIRQFIDSALRGGALQGLMVTAATFIGIALLQQAVSVGVTYLGENVAWTATNALRSELAWHCLNLDMGFHNSHTPGELIERIDGDIAELSNFFSQFVVTMVSNLLLLAGILGVLFYEDWRTGLAFTVFAFVALAILNFVRDIAVPYQKARRRAEADLFGFLEEQLTGTEDIRSSGAVGFSLRELFRLQAAILKHDRKAQIRNFGIETIMGMLLTLGSVMAIAAGYLLYNSQLITVGTVYLFIRYINMLEQPIWVLTHQMRNFQTIGACVQRLTDMRQIQPKVLDGGYGKFPEGPLPLSFEQVSFAYDSDEPVLHDLSFRLDKGRILGLLGRTGSGKTTLTRLIFRLYDPSSGRVLLGDQDIRQARMVHLRGRVAVVTQDVQLFRASLRDNLTFFDRTIPDQKIEEAISVLGLGDWFQSLPDHLDTMLETGGRSLSAGEAQLLALTRVFLRNPSLVILDEASSRLDPATEQRIERALDKLLRNRTAIIIAHRLSTVHRADQVMILDNGRVSEYGDRIDLAENPGSKFSQLLRTGLEEVLV
jgi:ABC-type multidrug transport system fused ATPase/permease subunit